jgi:hypothetical protein
MIGFHGTEYLRIGDGEGKLCSCNYFNWGDFACVVGECNISYCSFIVDIIKVPF